MPDPIYILGAAPRERVRVPTLTREVGVRELLEHPPSARQGGWNLLTLDRAELKPGPRLHVQNGRRKFLDVLEDGTFTAIGSIPGFLGHGRWDFSQKPLINGLALVEFTHEFVAFYTRLIEQYFEPQPEHVRFAVGVRNAHYQDQGGPRRLLLTSGPVGDHYGFFGDPVEAPDSRFDDTTDVELRADPPYVDVGRVSFALVRSFFNFYGFRDEAVPYVTAEGDAIDFDVIANM